MRNALMASKNKPNVNTVAGIVNITMIGFTTALRNANTTATMSADVNPSTCTMESGKRYDATKTAKVEMTILMIKFMLQS